jgi:TolB-like protein
MKRCPECRRDYYDDTLLYCLDDGSALLEGPASADEPATMILSEPGAVATGFLAGESPTRAQIHNTDQTAIYRTGAEAEPRSSLGELSERQSLSANRAAEPHRKRNKLLAIFGVAVLLLVSGFFGYRYFKSAGTEQISSIAVLPFENRSGNADSEYLSDGLSDSLIYRLTQLPNLKVSPTSSVIRYKGKQADVAEIALELDVDAVMSGKLAQRGDDLTISVELIDARTKKLIWAEQYDRKMSDLLATQREIATAITQKLQLKLGDAESKGITKKYTDNNEAYQAYLKGRYFWNRRTEENIKKAIEQFKAATDRDPNFALAYSGLADCHSLLPEYAGTPVSESIQKAKAFADRAIAIDDGLAEAHASMGQVNKFLWDWAGAEREYKRAIELDPKYATSYHWYSHVLRNLGRYDEALAVIKRGHEVDPLSSIISVNLSEVLEIRNETQASIDNSLKIIEIDPNFAYAYTKLGTSYLKLGRDTEGIANLEKGAELSNRAGWALMNLGYGYAFVKKRNEALAVAKELEERYAKKQSPGLFIAAVYSGLGDKNKAFEWLEKDFQNKEDVGYIKWRIAFEPLRDDPRYKDLMKRIGLPE